MKNKKLLLTCVLVLLAMIVTIPFMSACKGAPTPTEKKTLKIGLITPLGFPLGLDFSRLAQLMADVTNAKGGITVGGETYNVQVIICDSKFSDETARAAAERLISEDKVKFILGAETVSSWIPVTEANKVINISCDPSGTILDPKFKYAFNGVVNNTEGPELWGWFTKNYPNLKTLVLAQPDNVTGHVLGDQAKSIAESFGLKALDQIFYPPDTTDFSAIGTKVKNLNPDVFFASYGGPVSDNNCMKAAWQAGWKGQLFASSTVPVETMMAIVPPEAVEGMILGAWAVELDTPSGVAKELKDAYIAKNGKWDGPEVLHMNNWYILMAALKQANSLDVDKVAAVIANGVKYDSPCFVSPATIVSRPDKGITRTVDALGGLLIKKVVGGKVNIAAELSLDEALAYNKTFFGWK